MVGLTPPARDRAAHDQPSDMQAPTDMLAGEAREARVALWEAAWRRRHRGRPAPRSCLPGRIPRRRDDSAKLARQPNGGYFQRGR